MGSDKHKSILETARKRFQLAVEAEAEFREDALDDLNFRAGNQWPDDVKRSRQLENRPCLTINRIPQFVKQVTNDQRQNRPAIRVSPVDDKADVETAKVFQGLIRHIEYNSSADIAYDTAFDGAVTKGLGYFRVITDFLDPMSFDQEILIKRVRNSFSVYVDPYYQEPDGSDMNWGFITEIVSKEDYVSKYGESELSSMDDWESIGDSAPGWATDDSCRISEYFYKEYKNVVLVMLNDKSVHIKGELPEELGEGLQIVSERQSRIPVIKWCKINAVEILEETEWPGIWIPIIPVVGDELDVDGKVIREGIIRNAKDPQRMYNYWATSETETIALAPRAPFIGAEGQFEGHENEWATANTKSHAYLTYKEKSINGTLVGPPQRNVFEPPVRAITNARMQSSEDLKATTGIYDASLGARSNENSGIAIQRRNQQAQTSNFHFVDNLSRSMRHLGRILVDLIPKVYDTPRTMRIIGEDGEQEMVALNQIFEKKGKQVLHNLGAGKYDVTVDTGPSYSTKRQESLDAMLSLTQHYPRIAELAGDLMVRNMDWPGSQDIADRLKKLLPPELMDNEEGPEIPQQIQKKMQEMNALIEQLTERLNLSNDKIEKKTIEIESKERIEFAKIEADLRKELIKAESKAGIIDQQATRKELAQLQERQNLVGFNEPIEEIETAIGPGEGATPPNQPPTDGSSSGHFVEE